jgi:nicotinate-nucleotide adenylyltransferase
MKLAIFPGTFNPVHFGHLLIAESARIQFNLDKVHFVLSSNPPNKINAQDILEPSVRAEMLSNSILENKNFHLDLRELNRPGPSFTIDTVKEIRGELTGTEKVNVILGLDSFLSIPSWSRVEELAQNCRFLVASRPGWKEDDVADSLSFFHEQFEWHLIDSPPIPISSTLIRNRKKLNRSYRYMMPPEAFQIYSQINQ